MCGSAEIDVVNKNLLDMSEINTYKNCNIINDEIKTSALNNDYITFGFDFKKSLTLKNNEYVVAFKLKISSGTYAGRINALDLKDDNGNLIAKTDVSNPIMSSNFQQYIFKYSLSQTVDINEIIFQLSAGLNNVILEIKDLMILKGSYTIENLPSYIEHQSQTAIMPIQQEMLTGDYISSVEHHEWGKLVLDGENYGCIYMFENGRFVIQDLINKKDAAQDAMQGTNFGEKYTKHLCCTCLPVVSAANQLNDNLMGVSFGLNMSQILIKLDDATKETNTWTAEKINAYLNQKYNSGNPVTVYYKLATPVDLELTDGQKAVRNQKLYTYKKITNISVSDELASIDVNYKKDPTTGHDELQNQIDEIKQLISTTETSALLLDNLQKDVESEVE